MELKKDIVREIEGKQHRWYSHVMQLQDEKLVKQIVKWNQTGTRKHSRPSFIWTEEVRISMEKRSINDDKWQDQTL
jgi:hypothetical protein